jgi:drug/metabolite transporter (DMT)-like permease
MNTGPVLAIIAAVSFAVGIVLARKTAGEAGEAFSVTTFSIFSGIPLFAIVIITGGSWHNLVDISFKALGMLAAVGFIHFVIGRLLAYEAFRYIGANRAIPITQICPIITVILSWIFLDEKLTVFIALGSFFMIAGAFLITREKGSFTGDGKKRLPQEVKGIIFSLIAALCWGITPVIIKPAIEQVGSSVVGNFISYSTAGIILAVMLLSDTKRRNNFKRLSFKRNVLPMVISGIFTAGGQLLFYSALGKSPANVIAPLISIEILFIFLLSLLVNRRSEVFTLKVALGMLAAVAGTFLLFQ